MAESHSGPVWACSGHPQRSPHASPQERLRGDEERERRYQVRLLGRESGTIHVDLQHLVVFLPFPTQASLLSTIPSIQYSLSFSLPPSLPSLLFFPLSLSPLPSSLRSLPSLFLSSSSFSPLPPTYPV